MDGELEKPRYRIKTVGIKTGIPPITLRAWERRYQVLSPDREGNRYRLYSNADIQLLRWLKTQVDAGVPISLAAAEVKENLAGGEKIELPEIEDEKVEQSRAPVSADQFSEQLFRTLVKHDENAALQALLQAKASLALAQVF